MPGGGVFGVGPPDSEHKLSLETPGTDIVDVSVTESLEAIRPVQTRNITTVAASSAMPPTTLPIVIT